MNPKLLPATPPCPRPRRTASRTPPPPPPDPPPRQRPRGHRPPAGQCRSRSGAAGRAGTRTLLRGASRSQRCRCDIERLHSPNAQAPSRADPHGMRRHNRVHRQPIARPSGGLHRRRKASRRALMSAGVLTAATCSNTVTDVTAASMCIRPPSLISSQAPPWLRWRCSLGSWTPAQPSGAR